MWSFEISGTPDGVRRVVGGKLDQLAWQFNATQASVDIVAIKRRVLELLDAMQRDASVTGVTVKAHGSLSEVNGRVSHADCGFTVSRCELAL